MVKCAYHLDFEQSFIAIIQKIAGLSAVNSHHTKQKLAAEAQSHWGGALIDNGIDATLDV